MLQNLLERKTERYDKEAYVPPEDEREYLGELQSQYLRALWYHQTTHRYFNDKTLNAYMDRANDDSFLYVKPTPKDNWHSKTRRQTPREKFNALIAAILDQDLSPEIFAWDEQGKDMKDGAEAMQTLIAYSDYVEDAEEKRKLRAHELLKYGTCANEVSWVTTKKLVKKLGRSIPKNMEKTWDEGKEQTDFEGVWTKVVPLNRVILGDITKYFVEEQPFIWKEYVMTYDEAYNLFHDWKNWKYVKAVASEYDTWNDTTTQVDTEASYSATDRYYVRMRVYENKWSDEFAIVLNDVLMTPVGLPMPTPDKQCSITWTQLEPYDQAYAYGRSFFSAIHNDSVILDFLYNAIVDKARQGLEPPLVTSFKNLVNKNMFAPGKVTVGDINFKPAVLHQGVTSADLQIAKFVEENINKTSVAPIASGQSQGGAQTAYEIREQQKNALRMIGLALGSIARMERDIAVKKMAYVLDKYPKMTVARVDEKTKQVVEKSRTFIMRGSTVESSGVGRKEVAFGKLPDTDRGRYEAMKGMMEEEDRSMKIGGERVKKMLVDAEFMRKLKFVFQVVANPSQRKSKVADEVQAREDAQFALSLPTINPEWATRMWLRSKHYNEEEALQKQPPQQGPPGMQQAGPQAGAQGSPPQPKMQPPESPQGMPSAPENAEGKMEMMDKAMAA